mmetsp:Transcript_20143/g.63194  ORF Transcript_20143/g.63194 Transcript_20143/m.63194 type:complete len:301 (-) Transcript_20143:647-1549(-)|eukprot:scaffold12184_cov114-Isochrysis_galbana.AAC.7
MAVSPTSGLYWAKRGRKRSSSSSSSGCIPSTICVICATLITGSDAAEPARRRLGEGAMLPQIGEEVSDGGAGTAARPSAGPGLSCRRSCGDDVPDADTSVTRGLRSKLPLPTASIGVKSDAEAQEKMPADGRSDEQCVHRSTNACEMETRYSRCTSRCSSAAASASGRPHSAAPKEPPPACRLFGLERPYRCTARSASPSSPRSPSRRTSAALRRVRPRVLRKQADKLLPPPTAGILRPIPLPVSLTADAPAAALGVSDGSNVASVKKSGRGAAATPTMLSSALLGATGEAGGVVPEETE